MATTEKTTHMNLHKEWFDMILAGQKVEEYREITDYWNKRIENMRKEEIDTITFSNGYAKDRRQFIITLGHIVQKKGKEQWGAEPGVTYNVFMLGNIIAKINC